MDIGFWLIIAGFLGWGVYLGHVMEHGGQDPTKEEEGEQEQ